MNRPTETQIADVTDLLDGLLSPQDEERVRAEVAQDAALQRFAADEQRVREQLRAMDNGEIPAELAQRLTSQLRTATPARVSLWRTRLFERTLVFSAGVAVMLGVGWFQLFQFPNAATSTPHEPLQAQVLQLQRSELIGGDLVLNLQSTEFIGTATLQLTFPDGVSFEGLPNERTFAWETEIFPGDNLIALPLHVTNGVTAGNILAELQHDEGTELMWLQFGNNGS